MAAVTGYSTAAVDRLIIPGRGGVRVALLGDSITDFNFDYTAYPNTVQTVARGYFTWASILTRQRFQWVSPSTTDGAWGASGMTAYTMLNGGEATAASLSASDVVIVLAGTNDITDAANYSAGQIATTLQSIWNMMLRRGKRVIACTVMPRNNADNATQTQKLKDLNRLIRRNANITPGVTLCDWYGAVLNPSTGLANSSAYYIDGIHPNSVGASRLGAVLAQVLNQMYPGINEDISSDINDTNNYNAAGTHMSGTGGGVNSATGSVANNWTMYGGNSSYIAASKVARSDLWPGEWQQVVVTNNSNFTLQAYGNIGGANQPAVGDNIFGMCEFETDAANWAGTQLGMFIEFNGSSNVARGPQFAEQLNIQRPASGVLKTPTIPVPSGATLWKMNLFAYGNGTYRFGRNQISKP